MELLYCISDVSHLHIRFTALHLLSFTLLLDRAFFSAITARKISINKSYTAQHIKLSRYHFLIFPYITIIFEQKQWFNAGLILRWNLGLSTMEKYSKLKEEDVLKFTRNWVNEVKESVRAASPYISLLEVSEGVAEGNMIGDVNTIISFSVKVLESKVQGPPVYRQLSFEEMKLFHLKMTLSVSLPSTPHSTSDIPAHDHLELEEIKEALGTRVMLGQPVKLADPSGVGGGGGIGGGGIGGGGIGGGESVGTVVRIALGATMVISAFSEEGAADTALHCSIERIRREDAMVIRKMVLLAQHWDEIVAPVPLPAPVPVSVPVVPAASHITAPTGMTAYRQSSL
jgi:hypothetical protein